MSANSTEGASASRSAEAPKTNLAAPAAPPKAESILKSLLENIKNGKSPTKEQLGLYSALQSLEE